ncbi:MAG TPA: chemotaxis protein CheW [Burkholderiaceae bacterium]|nr:chemotaxis protein CheW [Burkholderiaceae bacterium]
MSEQTSAGSSGADFDLSQFYQVFFEEAAENLANMETQLLELDVQSPDDEELNAIFRCAHSIKGGAATFGFQDVADLTHVMETLLDRLRRHELALTAGMVDVLLESGDALTGLLDRHRGASDEVLDASQLVARIRAHADGVAAAGEAQPAAVLPAAAATTAVSAALPAAAPVRGIVAKPTPVERALNIVVGPLDDAGLADQLADLFNEIPGLGRIAAADDGKPDAHNKRSFLVHTTSSDDDLLDLFTFHVSRELVSIAEAGGKPAPVAAPGEIEGFGLFADMEASATPAPQVTQALPVVRVAPPAPSAKPERADKPDKSSGVDTTTLRVSVEKVDQLINLVGELVITQAMLAQNGRNLDPIAHQQLMGNLVDLERNTRLLQESVMAIRMIPMAVVFNRFPRMLRDLAAKLGKQVELHTVGEATELDKGMIEKITDPLTHLVRNALDHGIELPQARTAQGKPEAGTITLSAQHKGGSIAIEVRDDGKGLSRQKILTKAHEKGMNVHDAMTDHEVFQLIFEPGFSTADQVTEVSGRGVGMDVVRRNILSLGGSVELDSADGYGTRVTVRLPLTLAIMDGMSVAVGDEIYILPLASVIESIKLDQQQIRSVAGANRVIEVRNEFLPVVELDEVFRVPRFETRTGSGIMIVVEAEGARVALLVDELVGQHQVVVKNLEANYRKVPGVSGATILGDGRVALILDVGHMVRRARH